MSISINKIVIHNCVQNKSTVHSIGVSSKTAIVDKKEFEFSKESAGALKALNMVSFKGEEHKVTFQDGLKFDYLMEDDKYKSCEVYDRINGEHAFSMKYDEEEKLAERVMYNSDGSIFTVDRFDKGHITETDYYENGEFDHTHIYTEEDHKRAKQLLDELMKSE